MNEEHSYNKREKENSRNEREKNELSVRRRRGRRKRPIERKDGKTPGKYYEGLERR